MKGKSIPIVLIRLDKHRNFFYSSAVECEKATGIKRELIYSALHAAYGEGLIEGTDIYVDEACWPWDVEKYELEGDEEYGVQTAQEV